MKSSSRPSTLSLAAFCLGLLSLLQTVEARRWEDVILVSIYAQSNVDIPRIQYSLESDPFSTLPAPTMYQSEPPSDAPSSVPSYFADPNDEVTAQSSSSSSSSSNNNNDKAMSDAAVSQNCPSGESPYKINKFDTWGDGWGEMVISIREVNSNLEVVETTEESTFNISKDVKLEDYTNTEVATGSANRTEQNTNQTSGDHRKLSSIYEGGLQSGDFGSQHLCLSHTACYEVTLQGGKWQEEAKWEIVPVGSSDGTSSSEQVAVAKGQGVSNCTFYVSDSVVGHPSCPFTCRSSSSSPKVDQGASVAQEAPPVPQSTEVPTGAPSDAPSLVPTMV